MIAEVAHGLTWLAAGCAALLTFAAWRRPALAVPAALALGWLWLWIVGLLLWLFWSIDLAVAAVSANTQSRLPGGLRLAAAVLRPGGGWPVAAALVAWGASGLALLLRARWLGGVGLVALALHGVVLFVDRPFTRLSPAPTEGAGFDPGWRDVLAHLLPTEPAFAATLVVGTSSGPYRLAAVTPVAGADSTGVVAEIRIGADDPLVLTPEWRETMLPRHASNVPDSAMRAGTWWRASLGAPRTDGRWPVSVERVAVWPYALLLLGLAVAAFAAWRRR